MEGKNMFIFDMSNPLTLLLMLAVTILLIFLSTLCGNPRCQHSGRSGKWAVLFCSICCKCIKPRRQAFNSRAFVCQFRLQRRPCKVRQRIHHRIDLTIFHTCGAICRNTS